jgi:RTX calcium-binding nonapeptide repeat (4 copies)
MRGGRALILGLTVAALLAMGYSAADATAAFRLLSPARTAVISKPPLLRWKPAPGARSYNVQLWRGNRKLLSRWPLRPRLQLHARWRYNGRWYRLRPARYRWYVWPAYSWGFGAFRSRTFIIGRLPANQASPLVSGDAREGNSLSAAVGTWTGTRPLRFSYVWQRCEAGGLACSAIPGETLNTLTLGAGDIDRVVRVVVRASNLAGTRTAASRPTAVVLAARPVNLSNPRLTGGPQQGRVIAATVGRWQSSRPLTFSFRWKRCDRVGLGCRSIRGATLSGYLLRPADFKQRVKVIVRAVNSGGARLASALSPVVGRVFIGTHGPDLLSGSNGADLIRARSGSDRVFAGRGYDRIMGGTGNDVLEAGPGKDLVLARDGQVDFVACGSGWDVAVVDWSDHVRHCETAKRG